MSPRQLQESARNFAHLSGWATPLAHSLVRLTGFTSSRGISLSNA